MELVYLWIEEYKNIKNQGFNFSPRFECKYENGELSIEEKEYQSIFPDNINITAIVGKNGAGKSGVLELIFSLNIKNWYSKYIKIFKYNDKLYVFSNIFNLIINDRNIISCYLPTFPDKDNKYNQNYEYRNNIYNNIFLYKYNLEENNDFDNKENFYPNKLLKLTDMKFDDMKNIIFYILNNKHTKVFGNYFQPDKILIQYNQFYSQKISELKNRYNSLYLKNDNWNIKTYFIYYIYLYILIILDSLSLNGNIQNISFVKSLKDIRNFIDIYIKNYLVEDKPYDTFKRNTIAKNEIKKLLKYIDKINSLQEFDKLIQTNTKEFTFPLNININFLKTNFFIIEELPNCFNINFKDSYKNIFYNDLSSGEKSVLRVFFYIEKIIRKSKNNEFIFLLDEIENELHPEWQKKLLNYLIDTFKDKKQTFHFIFTTHSSFLLSDIPKENIIFLKNGKQIDVDINTFGANIHTLLTHGFFMNDGLIGEFAKSKINEVIKFLNNEKSEIKNNNEAKNIISKIGEPIIKRQLQKMLDSKRLSKIDEINELKKEIELLKHRMEILRKNNI